MNKHLFSTPEDRELTKENKNAKIHLAMITETKSGRGEFLVLDIIQWYIVV